MMPRAEGACEHLGYATSFPSPLASSRASLPVLERAPDLRPDLAGESTLEYMSLASSVLLPRSWFYRDRSPARFHQASSAEQWEALDQVPST